MNIILNKFLDCLSPHIRYLFDCIHMRKFTWWLLFLFILVPSYIVLYTMESQQDMPNWKMKELQQQFDSLRDDTVFSHQEATRPMIDWAITWRISIHNFPSLWIKIYSDDPYSESFKREAPFIIKNGNMLIDPFHPIEYIQVVAKNPNEDMKNIYEKAYLKQFGTWCEMILETGNNSYFTWSSVSNINVYVPSSWWLECYAGIIPNERYIQFWYNKNKPDRYYVVNIGVWCGGGKCSVFNQIELY